MAEIAGRVPTSASISAAARHSLRVVKPRRDTKNTLCFRLDLIMSGAEKKRLVSKGLKRSSASPLPLRVDLPTHARRSPGFGTNMTFQPTKHNATAPSRAALAAGRCG
jgi:hypothetical protein